MKYNFLFLFLFLFLLSLPLKTFALGNSTPITVDADYSERRKKEDLTILKGNVSVIFNQKFLRADEARVYSKKKVIEASGNVILQSAASTIYANKVTYNYESDEGESEGARILSGQTLLQGDKIYKLGERTYRAENALYTACISCPPAWHFKSREVIAELGDSAVIKGGFFNVWDFPIFPIPYLVIPLNANRKTGFLFPVLGGGGDGGMAIQIPFFWAINRSSDMTLSAKYYLKRGLQGLLNYRYLLNQNSKGELNFSAIRDKVFKGQVPNQSHNRWFFNYAHYFDLSNNYIQRAQLNLLGDPYYPMDFRKDVMSVVGDPSIESHASLTKNFSGAHFSIDNTFNTPILESEINFGASNPIHIIPEVRYNLTDTPLSKSLPFYGDIDFQYINFYRNWNKFDSMTPGSGIGNTPWATLNPVNTIGFNYGSDIIRAGQRIDITPTVSSPFWLFKKIDISPAITLRHTQYYLGVPTDANQGYDNSPHRSYIKLNTSIRSYFSGLLNNPDTSQNEYKVYKHYIIPEISLNFIPLINQTKHCFFTAPSTDCIGNLNSQIPFSQEKQPINDKDLTPGGRGLQFDYRDRIVGKRTIEFGINNKIIQKNITKNSQNYRQLLLFRLSQAYDFEEASLPGGGFPWQDINGLILFNQDNISLYSQLNYYPYHNAINTSTAFNIFDSKGKYLNISYNKFHVITPNPSLFNPDDVSRTETTVLSGGLHIPYLTFGAGIEFDLKTKKGRRWTFNTDLIPPGNCWKLQFSLAQDLGIQNFSWNLNAEFLTDHL